MAGGERGWHLLKKVRQGTTSLAPEIPPRLSLHVLNMYMQLQNSIAKFRELPYAFQRTAAFQFAFSFKSVLPGLYLFPILRQSYRSRILEREFAKQDYNSGAASGASHCST